MGNIVQSLFPTPTEEFPPTGVRTVDDITGQVKEVIAMVQKPEQMMNEFKYRQTNMQPPAEATQLINECKALTEAPQNIVRENSKIVEEVPKILNNPSQILKDPLNFAKKMQELIGDPNRLIQDYQNIIAAFQKVGENAKNLVASIPKYVEDYKKLIEEDYQKMLDYLKELPSIVPMITDAIAKLETFEEDLKKELSKFSGGLCSAARSTQLIKHNINSLQKYKTKYQAELDTAQKIVGEALEKQKEVEGLIAQAREYQKQAEDTHGKIMAIKSQVESMEGNAQNWIQKVEDLKNKEGEMKRLGQGAQNLAEGAFGAIKGFF